MEPIIIKDFPLPPSVNTMLMPVMGGLRRNKAGKVYASGRMVKSKEHIAYAKKCDRWALKYQKGLASLKREIQDANDKKEAVNSPFCLEIQAFYMFHLERILTVNGKPEQRDVDNLNKACLDNLCRILGIDDKHIFKITAEKCSTNQHECAVIKISQCKMRNKSEIFEILGVK